MKTLIHSIGGVGIRFAAVLLALSSFHTVAAQAATPGDASDGAAVRDAAQRLEAIGGQTIRDWRFRLGRLEGGGAVQLDDTAWETVSPEHKWRGENQDAWYRRRIEIPAKIAGFDVAGSTIRLEIGVDDFGEIWIDGKKRNAFEWTDGEAILTKRAVPGESFLVAVLAKNRGGPGRLLEATMHCSALAELDRRTRGYRESLKLARAVVKRLGNDDRRGETIIAASVSCLDFESLDAGNGDTFTASVDKARQKLSELKAITRGYKVHAVGYSHIDLAWLWRWEESVQVTKETFSAAIDFFEEFPDFRFSQSQSHAYRWMEKRYPKLFAAIEKEVAAGRWEIVGATNVELDCNLPGAESHIRQLLYGRRYFQEKFGKDVRIGWCPDSFGYNLNLPQILKKAGVDYFVTAKISWNDTNDFPYNCFWWEAPDGSRVLAFLPMGGYTFNMDGEKLLGHIAQLESQAGLKKVMSVYGVGNHGGGPTRDEIKRAKALKESDFFPDLEFSTALDYFESITPEERAKLPVWNDELYLEYHRGTYTTHAAVKKSNRYGECRLTTAEKLAALAMTSKDLRSDAYRYPTKRLGAAWDILLFNQMHDILPGSSITPVYRDTKRDYDKMFAAIRRTTRDAMRRLVDGLHTDTGDHEQVTVFNPSNWPRTEVVSIPWNRDDVPAIMSGTDATLGTVATDGKDGRRTLRFQVGPVPPLGYAVYRILRSKEGTFAPSASASDVKVDGFTLQNEHLTVTINEKTGAIASLVHKATGRETCADGQEMHVLQFHEDRPKRFDAWNLRFTGKSWSANLASVEVVESSPLRAVVRVRQTFLGEAKSRRHPTKDFPSSFFTTDYILDRGADALRVKFRADWWEDKVCLKVAFPTSVVSEKITYDAPYSHIVRSTKRETDWEKARYEVSAQYWADLSDDTFGVAILNDSKYGYDALGGTIRLTLLRSPTSPDRTADRGRHETEYAIYPHAGDWRRAKTVRAGYELNHPLVIDRRPAPYTRQGLPIRSTTDVRGSLVSVDAENVVLTVVKKHEDSDAWIVRFFEWAGTPKTTVTLTFPRKVTAAYATDLNEKKQRALVAEENRVTLDVAKYSIETLLVAFE